LGQFQKRYKLIHSAKKSPVFGKANLKRPICDWRKPFEFLIWLSESTCVCTYFRGCERAYWRSEEGRTRVPWPV
jgi:hypothetical protein